MARETLVHGPGKSVRQKHCASVSILKPRHCCYLSGHILSRVSQLLEGAVDFSVPSCCKVLQTNPSGCLAVCVLVFSGG